jgi:hypothetical protein
MTKLKKLDQSGIVSITITMLIIVIVSILSLGYARHASNEQRQALDYHLSTAAKYAAESGVNDELRKISVSVPVSTSCTAPQTYNVGSFLAGSIGTATLVGVSPPEATSTCRLVDTSPPELIYDEIPINVSKVINIEAASDIRTVTLEWREKGTSGNYNGANTHPDLPNQSSWSSNAGILRTDIIPLPPSVDWSAPLGPLVLLGSTMTNFFYPSTGGPSNTVAFSAGSTGQLNQIDCNLTGLEYVCQANITFGPGTRKIALRAQSLYRTNSLRVTASGSLGTRLDLINEQTVIDSTAKVTDVVKRVVVRVPKRTSYDFRPDSAIETGDAICKILQTRPGSTTTDNSKLILPDAITANDCDPGP